MKDFLQRELSIGDQVAVAGRGEYNKGLALGEIIKFTPKRVKVRFPLNVTWRGKPDERAVLCDDIVLLEPIDVTMYLLKRSAPK
jgi:hypothetical protein